MHSNILVDGATSSLRSEPLRREPKEESAGGQIAAILADNRELRAEIDQLRAERTRWQETQARIMALMGTTAPEKLVHDLRNVLNERDLLKALVDEM